MDRWTLMSKGKYTDMRVVDFGVFMCLKFLFFIFVCVFKVFKPVVCFEHFHCKY